MKKDNGLDIKKNSFYLKKNLFGLNQNLVPCFHLLIDLLIFPCREIVHTVSQIMLLYGLFHLLDAVAVSFT